MHEVEAVALASFSGGAMFHPGWSNCSLTSLVLLQVILGVSGTVMSVLSIGALEKFEVSSQADHITIVSLSPSLLMLAYRVS